MDSWGRIASVNFSDGVKEGYEEDFKDFWDDINID